MHGHDPGLNRRSFALAKFAVGAYADDGLSGMVTERRSAREVHLVGYRYPETHAAMAARAPRLSVHTDPRSVLGSVPGSWTFGSCSVVTSVPGRFHRRLSLEPPPDYGVGAVDG